MITTDVLPDRVEMRAYGIVTLSDCKTFEQISDRRVEMHQPLDLLVDLRAMTECSLEVALEELRYVRAHRADFRRMAVLTDDQMVTWSAWLTQFFSEADIRVFQTERAARRWLDGDSVIEDSDLDISLPH
ncbi:STAS/SEC14 domain-containing protein [Uliginosibacterium paludis]|jgi:hypothetical protein|uniref:STAS/SEC14 domain-containing protein n=1 Tax=Uliginosibacterium paludis TaxID=1615952 RepID=A0ABV2CQM9_9RHOO